MLVKILQYSINHKLIILLFSISIAVFGVYSLSNIPIGAVPDVTNNQVQIITTSRNLATEDVEKFLTYPVELEMANLPGVKEMRSVSKFGLSVITVVFDDNMGTYLPRQLIAEKIKNAEEKIPTGFGKPFMGPITTGLGEIYQYVIDVDSAYRNQYSLSDIRTIQDWLIKRQLSGISGVVEVNTWGGYLKQYEVAVNPERLKSLNISVAEVYSALEKNNSIVGGGYIEKSDQTYFIRGDGLVGSISDIENIVVETRYGNPILIKNIANVGFGHATRFGAITANGEGEKVLGQVMMLKGANSNAVIEAVKKRVAEIETTLPPGIHINPFLERSELIAKTSFTIAENLILGCLIVIFVVVLLLGNWRSGLVVASVIPMSLLFALSMMYIFKVDANLMSLGAIDFGIIIDGAVIIIEFIAFQISSKAKEFKDLGKKESTKLIDSITYKSASKMMHSAIFGQIIIIIVFIPILTLVGVEGKMFRPMAMVFCFALIGAMILCFTYVPVVASIFIKPTDIDKKTISTRLVVFLQRIYRPSIEFALKQKVLVLSVAFILLLTVGFLFTKMGGEFVPTLDEGDFVIQPVLKTGTSLSETVAATTQMEKILRRFPEVKQVVSRIGAAEVPTDPMSMEESDIIIKLRPISEWTNASSKDELADVFKNALVNEIPGVEFEFTQPIEMRFNELITGVRADLAIKIFGEDLDILLKKANEVEKAIKNIEGASDIIVEKIAGLPQMSVKYDRAKIAKYGIDIDQLNKLISIGFAGMPAGTVFEGEKQFDLVVRFDPEHHKSLDNLKNANILLPNGNQLPLREFAEIKYTTGPAKISRDNTKRRIVVGVNVRNRDLESVVNDVQNVISSSIKLPTGYTVEYGGQFENLRQAKQRLTIAVPIALILIFVFLYFAFNSIKEALLIFTAIPLSAIGGVLLLYARDLPFSISAGVGFIALFGIAVLNGIVLIEEFKELKAKGWNDIHHRIIEGTTNRLRPVLLTAAAAALGFLPMAISTSAGAEVQRPLATVVIGGLISATFLTLIVLPVLYSIFEKRVVTNSPKSLLLFLPLLFIIPTKVNSQNQSINLNEAISIAEKNNLSLKASESRITMSKQLEGNSFNFEKTEIYYHYDENNIAPNNLPIRVWGISQNFKFPGVYSHQNKLSKSYTQMAQDRYELDLRLLRKEISKAYFELVYWQNLEKRYQYLDSIYSKFTIASTRRFESGESNYLERLTAESKAKEISIELIKIEESRINSLRYFNSLLQSDTFFTTEQSSFEKLEIQTFSAESSPANQLRLDAIQSSIGSLKLEKQGLLPDFNISVFQGTNNGENAQMLRGIQAGVLIPIWFGAHKARINAAKTEMLIRRDEAANFEIYLNTKHKSLLSDLKQYEEHLNYYNEKGKALSTELIFHSQKAFENGQIDFLQLVIYLENAQKIEIDYWKALLNYNLTVLDINYLTD